MAIRDEPVSDNFAECPDWARAQLDRRLATLDRGEGLTTQQMVERMRAWREERRQANTVTPDGGSKVPGI